METSTYIKKYDVVVHFCLRKVDTTLDLTAPHRRRAILLD